MMPDVLVVLALAALLIVGLVYDSHRARVRREKSVEAWVLRFEQSAAQRSRMPTLGGGRRS